MYPHPGALDFSGDVVDPATGAVALRARVPNPEHRLLPGTFVTLKATLGEQRDAYRVPQVAVQRDAAGRVRAGASGRTARSRARTSSPNAWTAATGSSAAAWPAATG